MTTISAFLNALFASTDADIEFDLAGESILGGDREFVAQHEGQLRVSPFTADGSCFVFRVMEDAAEDSHLECRLPPTVALYRDSMMIVAWAFDRPVDDIGLSALTNALGMVEPTELTPLPGTNGWKLVHVAADCVHTFDALLDAYVAPQVVSEPVPLEKYGDALVRFPYNETDYQRNVTFTLGARKDSKQWKPLTQPLAEFIAKLCRNFEGTKDGTAFVLADMVPGPRLKNSVKTLCGVGLDIDTGTPSAVVDAAIDSLKCMAVRYSTHSHAKTVTEIKKDRIIKFAGNADIDDDVIRRFLAGVEHWDSTIVVTASYDGSKHTERGIMAVVRHAPIPKHRIIVPFEAPFEIANEAPTQADAMRKWAKVPTALAKKLGVPLDTSCTDPSRLFYLPRHDKNRPFEISLWGGPLFDWRTLQLDNPLDQLTVEVSKGTSKSVTVEGRELGRWSIRRCHGFQIVDMLEDHCPDRIRGSATNGVTIECPFNDHHSNAGDTEDSACFAVNAGTGMSEFFTISCRHESCRDKTMLDMLGKMIKEGWFERDVIEDEQYNAVLDEDAPQLKVAEKVGGRDKAKESYQTTIDALTPGSTEAEITKAIETAALALLSPIAADRAIKAISDRSRLGVTAVKKTFAKVRATTANSPKPGVSVGKTGGVTFTYSDDYNFDEACDTCIAALIDKNKRDAMPTLSQMSGYPVRFTMKDGRAEITELTQSGLWSELSNLVHFVKASDKGSGVRKPVDRDVAAHVYEQAYRTVSETPEVIYTPIYLRDGGLVETAGWHLKPEYNLNTVLILDGLKIPKVPKYPTAEDAAESLTWLKTELLSSFPFLDSDEAGNEGRQYGEANALAMLLTPFMRRMISGRTPLFFVSKPSEGTGGTLLGLLSIALFDGEKCEGGNVNYCTSEEELEKRLVAAIMKSPTHLFFDDVKDFNNRVLLRALVAARVGGRELGRSRIVERDNNFNWISGGNNPKMGREMRRRTVLIRLNARKPNATKRDFRHADLLEYVKANRGLAIRHILTLIEFWLESGSPKFTAQKKPGFDDWVQKVGGVLETCGVKGFLGNKEPVAMDTDHAAENAFFVAAHAKFGADAEMMANKLYEWADNVALEIIRGRNPEDRRERFMSTLPGLVGKTFENNNGFWMFDATNADTFKIKKIQDGSADA